MLKEDLFSTLFTCYGTQPSLENMERHYQVKAVCFKVFLYKRPALSCIYL